MLFLSSSQIGRESVDRADEIGDGVERRFSRAPARAALEPFADDIGLGDFAPARFRLDIGYQGLGQSHC